MAHENDFRPVDLLHVSVQHFSDIRYWSRELKCTPDQLRAAVKAAGSSTAAIKEHLETR